MRLISIYLHRQYNSSSAFASAVGQTPDPTDMSNHFSTSHRNVRCRVERNVRYEPSAHAEQQE